jgi:hypothetical protein
MNKTTEAIRTQLRDTFAASALTGMLANSSNDAYKHEYAKSAYEYADEMLKAREEE